MVTKFGEYGGCSSIVMHLLVKNYLTENASFFPDPILHFLMKNETVFSICSCFFFIFLALSKLSYNILV